MDIENDWPAFYDWAHASFTDDVEFYLEELKDVKGPVLELGCGTGRVTIPLAKQGDANAQFNLGFMYDDGLGVHRTIRLQ